MAISWINSFNFFSNFTVSIVKDKTLSSVIDQRKKIAAVVLIALGCLAGGLYFIVFIAWLETRCTFVLQKFWLSKVN